MSDFVAKKADAVVSAFYSLYGTDIYLLAAYQITNITRTVPEKRRSVL